MVRWTATCMSEDRTKSDAVVVANHRSQIPCTHSTHSYHATQMNQFHWYFLRYGLVTTLLCVITTWKSITRSIMPRSCSQWSWKRNHRFRGCVQTRMPKLTTTNLIYPNKQDHENSSSPRITTQFSA